MSHGVQAPSFGRSSATSTLRIVAKSSSARRAYGSEWLLEFSVLLAVFPLLDQALEQRFSPAVTAVSSLLSVLSFLGGLMLAEQKDD